MLGISRGAWLLVLLLTALPSRAEEAPPEDWLFQEEVEDPADADPWESGNRVVFAGNEHIYRWVLDPISRGYRRVVPRAARDSVRRFFENLNTPVILLNDLLQGEGRRAGRTGTRFVVNSTLGVLGLFDPAAEMGFKGHRSDFGETLAIYGVEKGIYLVIPLIGPSTSRDAVGEVVDALLRPDTWLLSGVPLFFVRAGDSLSLYEVNQVRLEELRRSSVDFYAALRGAFIMEREARTRAARSRSSRRPISSPPAP